MSEFVDKDNWTRDIINTMEELYLQLQNKPDEDERIQSPPGLQVTLFTHQEHALAWMLWRENSVPAGGILADDIGLGKTITTIALIMKSLENESIQKIEDSRKNSGGTLIICPANLINHWTEEIQKKGNIPVIKIFHREKDRNILILCKYQVVITSYEALLSSYTHYKILFKIHWRRVVLDEADIIKNSDTRESQCFAGLIADKRWALTGIKIDIKDIFPIVKFLHIQPFDDLNIFNKWIDNDEATGTARLHRVLECMMLRRTMSDLIDAGLMPELLGNDYENPRSNKEEDVVATTIKNIHSDLERKPGNEVKVRGPQQLQVKLLDYQQHILACMLWRERCKPAGGILIAGMSIDRIIMTISLILKSLENQSIQIIKDYRKNPGGTLIVCQDYLIREWKMEIENKGNISEVIVYHGEKEKDILVLGQYKIVITTYEELSGDPTHNTLFKIHWRRVILDNFHFIRTSLDSSESECVTKLLTDKRWAVIGDKMNNIFPILGFLKLKPFDDLRIFNKEIAKNGAPGKAILGDLKEYLMINVIRNRLYDAKLQSELPRKTDRTIDVFMAPEVRFFYETVMDYTRTLFIEYMRQMNEEERQRLGLDTRNYSAQLTPAKEEFLGRQELITLDYIKTLIIRLRQICCHPALLKNLLEKNCRGAGDHNSGELEEILNDIAEYQSLTIDNSVFNENIKFSKITEIVNLVKDIIDNGERVIIVSNWMSYLNLIGHHLKEITGARYRLYTGNPNYALNSGYYCFDDPFDYIYQTMILMMTLNTAEEKLDLTAANHVIIADVHWDKQLEMKALKTVYRIGQTREVFIHKFVCKDTVEEKIVKILDKNFLEIDDIVAVLDM